MQSVLSDEEAFNRNVEECLMVAEHKKNQFLKSMQHFLDQQLLELKQEKNSIVFSHNRMKNILQFKDKVNYYQLFFDSGLLKMEKMFSEHMSGISALSDSIAHPSFLNGEQTRREIDGLETRVKTEEQPATKRTDWDMLIRECTVSPEFSAVVTYEDGPDAVYVRTTEEAEKYVSRLPF